MGHELQERLAGALGDVGAVAGRPDVGRAQFLTGARASHLVRRFGQGQQARGEGAELVGGVPRQGWRDGRFLLPFFHSLFMYILS
nr:J290 [uncultured bacterium]